MRDRPSRKAKPQHPGEVDLDVFQDSVYGSDARGRAAAAGTGASASAYSPALAPLRTLHTTSHGYALSGTADTSPISLFQPSLAPRGYLGSEHEHLITANELSLNRVATRFADTDAGLDVGTINAAVNEYAHALKIDGLESGGGVRAAIERNVRASAAAVGVAGDDGDATWGGASESESAYDGDSEASPSPDRCRRATPRAMLAARARPEAATDRGENDAQIEQGAVATGAARVTGATGAMCAPASNTKRKAPQARRPSAKRTRCALIPMPTAIYTS